MKRKIPYRNQNRTGWWIYAEIEYYVSRRQKKVMSTSRCLVWENLRIIKAKNRDEAYAKAMAKGRAEYPSETVGGEWRFAGIAELLPIYEELEDGAEVLWKEKGTIPFQRIQGLVKNKKQLCVFDDREKQA